MAIHSKNEALMCKVFQSSFGPVAMRWFNGLRMNSVDSYKQLTQAFGSRFVTHSRPPRPMSVLLSLTMHDDETLKAYSDKYWEIYNELDGKYDDVAINTFKNGLPMGHGLRKSLTSKLTTSVRQLMDRIDKYKRAIGAVFREPVHRVLEKIKNEPYFKWSNKMSGDPEKRNQDRYCQYHEDHGHTTEDCRNL
ncbi:uncharacterized protein LOC136065565 [Quercus suber]|uniref:uncharacterized protein LOC136065565 n=1 Tax=Quercus suber TaxID=58331 RepID=UPI0032DECD2C